MQKNHNLQHVNVTENSLNMTIDGKEHTFSLAGISYKLSHASDTERKTFRIMASGYGIHWPLLDEDLSIDGLLGIVHAPSARKTQEQAYQQAA
jgi:hypothetical protein